MNIRLAAVAGMFYESSRSSCETHAIRLVESVVPPRDLPAKLYGGLVPHAGWVYSGRLAAMTLKSLAHAGGLETVVLFGADHRGTVGMGEVLDSGVWRTPLGEAPVDSGVAAAILAAGGELLRANPAAHQEEHSLEVQLPLLQIINPSIRIVPIGVPVSQQAAQIGKAVGRVLAEKFPQVKIVGSTDLTHHGGRFGSPGGRGRQGVDWTVANDRRIIDLIAAMKDEQVIAEVAYHHNACGGGAIAAAIAACRELGATSGRLLGYTNSYEVSHAIYPDEPDDTTVGYAAVVFQ